MADAFSNPNLSNSRSLAPSQSDISSCDTDPENHNLDLDPIFEVSGRDYPYDDDQVSFITNLFDRAAENGLNCNSQVGFELGSCNSEVDLELGLGLGLGVHPAEETRCFEGLRVVSADSESDSDDEILGALGGIGGALGFGGDSDFDCPPFCWDYLGFNNNDSENFGLGRVEREVEASNIVVDDDGVDDNGDGSVFFLGGRHDGFDDEELDDRDIEPWEESFMFNTYETEMPEQVIHSDTDEGGEFGVEGAIRDLEWEILLAVNNFNREVYDMGFNVDMYEAILGEVEDGVNDWRGSPPASLSVIENLRTVCLSREVLEENNVVCAICKDEVSVEEMVRQLPCLHYYHGDCIVPWLKIRNTCPVCRHELPTDDPEYKNRRREGEELSADGDGDVSLNSQLEYDFHVFL